MKMTKKTTKQEVTATTQALSIEGVTVKNVWYKSAKMGRFSIDVVEVTPKGTPLHYYIPCVCFGDCNEIEEGDNVNIIGSLFYDAHETKKGDTTYTLSIKVGGIEWN